MPQLENLPVYESLSALAKALDHLRFYGQVTIIAKPDGLAIVDPKQVTIRND